MSRMMMKFSALIMLFLSGASLCFGTVVLPELVQPITVKDAQMFSDGGTISIVLEDHVGKTFSFCLDGRLQQATAWQAITGSHPKRHLYINATHPSIVGAQELPIGGAEEKMILKILQDLMNPKYSKEQRQQILNSPGTDENFKDRWVLRVLQSLQGR